MYNLKQFCYNYIANVFGRNGAKYGKFKEVII